VVARPRVVADWIRSRGRRTPVPDAHPTQNSPRSTRPPAPCCPPRSSRSAGTALHSAPGHWLSSNNSGSSCPSASDERAQDDTSQTRAAAHRALNLPIYSTVGAPLPSRVPRSAGTTLRTDTRLWLSSDNAWPLCSSRPMMSAPRLTTRRARPAAHRAAKLPNLSTAAHSSPGPLPRSTLTGAGQRECPRR
jgi:hypothetical protein